MDGYIFIKSKLKDEPKGSGPWKRAQCPIKDHEHDHRNPGFSIHKKGVWHCFKCGVGGGPADLCRAMNIPVPEEFRKQKKSHMGFVYNYLKTRSIKEDVIAQLIDDGLIDAYEIDGKKQIHFYLIDTEGNAHNEEGKQLKQIFFFDENDERDGKPRFAKGTRGNCFFFFGNRRNPRYVFITESIINAVTMIQLYPGSLAFSVLSANGGGKMVGIEEEWSEKIIVVPDNDEAGERLSRTLARKIEKVKGITWPENFKPPADRENGDGYDVNDLLMDGREEEIKELVENASLLYDPLLKLGIIFKDKRGPHINIPKFVLHMRDRYHLRVPEGETTIFRFKNTHYERQEATDINSLCGKYLDEHFHLFKEPRLKEFIHFTIQQCKIPVGEDDINHIPLKNGLYHIEKDILVPHSSDVFVSSVLPYEFDRDATCPVFLEALGRIFEGDEDTIKTIQELYGYVFYRKAPVPIEKMFIFYGEGRNGKSVMLDLLEMLVGSQNVASVMMSDLKDQNMRAQLYQKWVNVVAETPTKRAIEADLVKKIVSGDLISARRVYQPVMDFRPFAKHFISANILPQIDEQTEAMRRRIMVIPFNHDFRDDPSKQPKPELLAAFQREMPGILNWAVEGLRRLKGRNWNLYPSPAIEDATREYLESSNSVKRFLKERCVHTGKEKDRWVYSEFYREYFTFCEDTKLEAIGPKKLRKELERQGVIVKEGTGRVLTVYRWRPKTATELIGSWKSEYNE